MTLLRCQPPLCNCSTFCAVDLCYQAPQIFFATIFMLLSLLCRYWTISLLFYLWHSSIGFWHHFNGKSTQLHLYKTNIPSVSEILSTCRLLEWPISWTLLYPHYHRTTFMSTTRSSWRSTWRCLSFPKLGWEKNPNLICSKLKKKTESPSGTSE